jgi:hypothetical protein
LALIEEFDAETIFELRARAHQALHPDSQASMAAAHVGAADAGTHSTADDTREVAKQGRLRAFLKDDESSGSAGA